MRRTSAWGRRGLHYYLGRRIGAGPRPILVGGRRELRQQQQHACCIVAGGRPVRYLRVRGRLIWLGKPATNMYTGQRAHSDFCSRTGGGRLLDWQRWRRRGNDCPSCWGWRRSTGRTQGRIGGGRWAVGTSGAPPPVHCYQVRGIHPNASSSSCVQSWPARTERLEAAAGTTHP